MEYQNETPFNCPICDTQLETNYETGHETCVCCLRDYIESHGQLVEVQTDVYHY